MSRVPYLMGGQNGVVTATDPTRAAADALKIGSRFGQVVLAPIGSDDMPRDAKVREACEGLYPVQRLPGTWYAGTSAFTVDQDGHSLLDENGAVDENDLLVLRFNSPGVKAAGTLKGSRGELISFARAGTATLLANGVEVTAQADEARVDEDGLLIEPACTQLFTHADDMTHADWVEGTAMTVVAGGADPLGGTTAFTAMQTNSNESHAVYQLVAIPASASSISIYAKPINGLNFLRIQSNGATYNAVFNLGTGVVTSVAGANAKAEIEPVGSGWYRCSLRFIAGTALMSFATGDTAAHAAAAYVGDPTMGMLLWRPQAEANEYATTWTATSRAAESAVVAMPAMGGEWCVEITAIPCGPRNWNRGTHMPMFSIGTYGAANSLEGYGNAGTAVTSVFDGSAGEKTVATATLDAGSLYVGQRRIAFASSGLARPAIWVDGRQQIVAAAGAGTGIYNAVASTILRLGATSAAVIGGFRFREVRVRKCNTPARRSAAAAPYARHMGRGYSTLAQCIAFLGDSNTEGLYDGSITAPYPVGACATLGAAYQPHNYGIGSNTAQQTLDRWRSDIKGRGYSKMVLFIGVNDVSLDISAAGIIQYLATILAEAAEDGVAVYPITILPGNYAGGTSKRIALDGVNTWLAAYATAHSLHLIDANTHFDDGLGKIAAAWDLASPASLHLSQAGQTELAGLVATALAL